MGEPSVSHYACENAFVVLKTNGNGNEISVASSISTQEMMLRCHVG